MLSLILPLVLVMIIGVCGVVYNASKPRARAEKRKLKKIAKEAEQKVSLCKGNEKTILKIKDQLEQFSQ